MGRFAAGAPQAIMIAPSLTLLYTARLRGALDYLPRLFSLIRQVRAGVQGPVMLLDLGESCDPAQRECAATQGRATLFVLDAMGYDLACLTAAECARLPVEAAQRLQERVTMGLCGAAHASLPLAVARRVGDRRVALVAPGAEPLALPAADLVLRPAIGLRPAVTQRPAAEQRPTAEQRQGPAVIDVPLVTGDQLGVLAMRFEAGGLAVAGLAWRCEAMPPGLQGDATVAAMVAFIRDEIRLYRHAD